MHLFELLGFFLDTCPGVRLLDHIATLVLWVFEGNSILFSTVAATIYTPINSVGWFCSPHPLQYLLFKEFFYYDSRYNWCEGIPYGGFDLYFSTN